MFGRKQPLITNRCDFKHPNGLTCGAPKHVLSYFDQYDGEVKNFPTYQRTTKWKCENGHRVDTQRLVDYNKRPL
jgi:hypothetical protein